MKRRAVRWPQDGVTASYNHATNEVLVASFSKGRKITTRHISPEDADTLIRELQGAMERCRQSEAA